MRFGCLRQGRSGQTPGLQHFHTFHQQCLGNAAPVPGFANTDVIDPAPLVVVFFVFFFIHIIQNHSNNPVPIPCHLPQCLASGAGH